MEPLLKTASDIDIIVIYGKKELKRLNQTRLHKVKTTHYEQSEETEQKLHFHYIRIADNLIIKKIFPLLN
jgi:hypothetical protein